MKHLFSYVLSVLLCIAFTTARAQQNIYIWKNGGHLSVKAVSNTDSLTFEVGSRLFNISTSSATSVTTSTLQATANVSFAKGVESISKSPEVGICYSSTNATPTYEADEHLRLGSEVKNYDFTLYELDPGTEYYYRTYVKFGEGVFYGNVRTNTTFGEKPKYPNYVVVNGHKFVNLGLPSGLLWAKDNIGAAFSSDAGDYFAWGETETKIDYSWDTYKWGSDKSNLTKYNWSLDRKNTLDPEDDVATIRWGEECRMPTYDDFQELISKCSWTWEDDYNGAKGYLVTGPNAKTIFFPAVQYYKDAGLVNYGFNWGLYWSSSGRDDRADNLSFSNGYMGYPKTSFSDRCLGITVRPVSEYKWWELPY